MLSVAHSSHNTTKGPNNVTILSKEDARTMNRSTSNFRNKHPAHVKKATNSSLCHEQKHVSSLGSSSYGNVLVVGASSFIGASIAKLLHKTGESVVATEDSVNIGFDPLAWYRWEKLTSMGLSPQFVNYSDFDITFSFVKKHSPKTIIYIPTPLFENISDESLRQATILHEDFLVLLQIVTSAFRSTSIMLLSMSELESSHRSIIRLFELSLSVYHHLYDINMFVIRLKGVYGPWQSMDPDKPLCYIGSVFQYLHRILGNIKSPSSCMILYNPGCDDGEQSLKEYGKLKTKTWLHDYNVYRKHQSKDVIASSYVTKEWNPQYPIDFVNNNYYFMENWFKNIYKMGLHMAVFHDNLSEKFTSTFMKSYSKSDFLKIERVDGLTPNDRRFLAYYNYILAHPEIGHIVMTDMRDVIIQNNPFEVMNILGDMIYVGTDLPFQERPIVTYLPEMHQRCFYWSLDDHRELRMLGFFNAGAIGASRHVLLAFLTRFIQYLNISSKQNCNMGIVEYILHKFFFDATMYGWPFNAGFLSDHPSIPGLAVLHKWN